MRPRPYLSFSQMTKFEMSPEKFVAEYLHHQKQRISRNMVYGSMFAEGLESGEASGDPLLDMMMAKMPKFDVMDKVIEDASGTEVWYGVEKRKIFVPVLDNGKDPIPLLAKPDTARSDYSAFKEYKTSVRKWTQKMADESGQVTFYVTAIWLKTGLRPDNLDIELTNAQVQYRDDGSLMPTGDIWRFPTKRTMTDVLKMTTRMRKAWAGIKELCENELL